MFCSNRADIEKLCKRVIIINNGQVVMDDSMENLKYNYLNKKIVEVKMREKVNLDDEDGILILKDKVAYQPNMIFESGFLYIH